MLRLPAIIVSLIMLVLLLFMAWDAPISGDEEVHYRQAQNVLRYYRSLGTDTAALHTPITHLRDYGQSFDNATTLLIEVLDVKNPYRLRHLCNAVAAWLIILLCGRLLWHLTGHTTAALIGMMLLLISPRFAGHALNNLKDIPFALGYLAAVYGMIRLFHHFPSYRKRHLWMLVGGIALAISIRVGGILLICYLWAFALFRWYQWTIQSAPPSRENVRVLWRYALLLMVVTAGGYFGGLLFWPYALENPIVNPWISLGLMHDYPTTVRQIFEGTLYWSEQFPWYYALKYILITVPLAVPAGLVALVILAWKALPADRLLPVLFLLISAGFPLFYTAATGANLYGGWRQVLFVYPPLLVAGVYGLFLLWTQMRRRWSRWALVAALLLASYSPVRHLAVNHPYYTIYFNQLAGGCSGAYGHYEWDYYFTGFKEAFEQLIPLAAQDLQAGQREVRVATNFLINWYFDTTALNIRPVLVDYYKRGYYDWDYGIFCNTFVHPHQLQKGLWPPGSTVEQVLMEGAPVSIVIRRRQRYDLRAFRYLKDGQPQMAHRSATRAVKEEPDNESALLLLARAEAALQLDGRALQTIDRLLDIYPGNDDAEDLRGEIHFDNGDIARAASIWQNILQRNYKYYHAYVNLARAAWHQGRKKEAMLWLRRCLGLNPFYRPAVVELGKLYQQQGKPDKAARYFDRAKKL